VYACVNVRVRVCMCACCVCINGIQSEVARFPALVCARDEDGVTVFCQQHEELPLDVAPKGHPDLYVGQCKFPSGARLRQVSDVFVSCSSLPLYIYIYTYIYMYIYMYIHIYSYIYVYIYTDVQIPARRAPAPNLRRLR